MRNISLTDKGKVWGLTLAALLACWIVVAALLACCIVVFGLGAWLNPAHAQDTANGWVTSTAPILDDQSQAPLSLTTDGDLRTTSKSFVKNGGTTQVQELTCRNYVAIGVAAGATGKLVTEVVGQNIYVCSFVITGDTLATTAQFKYGTAALCGTGTTNITGPLHMVDEGSIAISADHGTLFYTVAGTGLCITSAVGAVTGFVSYAQF